jgi:hemin uptake protein HemP
MGFASPPYDRGILYHCNNCGATKHYTVSAENIRYIESIFFLDGYEETIIQHDGRIKTSWEELDVVLHEFISEKITKW